MYILTKTIQLTTWHFHLIMNWLLFYNVVLSLQNVNILAGDRPKFQNNLFQMRSSKVGMEHFFAQCEICHFEILKS